MSPSLHWLVLLALASMEALLGAGCDTGVRGGTGLNATLRASSGTFMSGAIPTTPDPAVTDGRTVVPTRYPSTAFPGQGNQPFAGGVRMGGQAVAVGLADDSGYWIIPAPMPNREAGANGELLFSSNLSFAPTVSPGNHDLVMRAIGGDGRMGAALIQPIMISGFANVTGAFQIKLLWDTNADLDLHVIVPVNPADLSDPTDPKAPKTIEVWANRPSSLPARPIFDPYTMDQITAGGLLDYDSNANCVLDGRREENITWGAAPPAGHYIVRVDTVSLCGEPDAQWQLSVFKDGNPTPINAAYGESVDSDTRYTHTQGAGLLALEFDLP